MELVCDKSFDKLPSIDKICEFVNEVRYYLFPGYYQEVKEPLDKYEEKKKETISTLFLSCICSKKENLEFFFKHLDEVEDMLKQDSLFFQESDPACEGLDEIILTYPGFFAITYYRIAHIIYDLKVPYIPRMISEFAHSKTGIDIHPGATISSPFFIDHGTGIVVGETSIIGHHVKLYHGVTLGALSLAAGSKLRGEKRHPTVGNYVTIYSGASILGGKTKVGDNVTIGSNVFIVDSVLPHSKIVYENKINK